mmetsp:Transcript_28570/g.73300  ORF Transcript_28570/g.73300 Transcript_28570/m.73300 type:complete len:128 (-) Transcript_28570:194-577(-)
MSSEENTSPLGASIEHWQIGTPARLGDEEQWESLLRVVIVQIVHEIEEMRLDRMPNSNLRAEATEVRAHGTRWVRAVLGTCSYCRVSLQQLPAILAGSPAHTPLIHLGVSNGYRSSEIGTSDTGDGS